MSRPSTDTRTELAVEKYRREGIIPSRVTLRFLALLKPKELSGLATKFELQARTSTLSFDKKTFASRQANRRRNLSRLKRVRSEIAQRPRRKK